MLLPHPIPLSLLDGAAAPCEFFFARGCLPFGELADGCDCCPLTSKVCASPGKVQSTTEHRIRRAEFFFTGISTREMKVQDLSLQAAFLLFRCELLVNGCLAALLRGGIFLS